jgi:hypothetical protein
MLIFPSHSISCPQCKLVVKRREKICPYCQYHISVSELNVLNYESVIQFNKSKKIGYITVIIIFVVSLVIYVVGNL